MDRVLINNQLISLKGIISRAKLFVINGLTKKIRRLQRAGNENSKRSKARVNTALIEIKTLKNMKMLEVAKQALLVNSDEIELIDTTTPEERAMTRIYSHELVINAVKAIKKTLNLETLENDWRSFVINIGTPKEKYKKNKNRTRTNISLMRRTQSNTNQISYETDKTSKDCSKNNNFEREINLEMNPSDQIENCYSDTNQPKKFVIDQSDLKDESISDFFHLDDVEMESLTSHTKIINVIDDKTISAKRTINNDYQAEVKNKYKDIKAQNSQIKFEQQEVDPFFVTSNGGNYMTNIKSSKNTSFDSSNIKLEERTFKNRFERRNGVKKFVNDIHNKKRNYSNKSIPKNDKTFNQTPRFANNIDSSDINNLHPSWKAKIKEKVIIPFQGTKIKFNGEHTEIKTVPHILNNSSDEKPLHPSWEAKMKYSAPVKFEGSKIKFDE